MMDNELLNLISEQLDPEDLVDVLGLTTAELVSLGDVRYYILENIDKFNFLLGEEYDR